LAKSMIMRSVWIFLSEFAASSWTKDSSWVSQDLHAHISNQRHFNVNFMSLTKGIKQHKGVSGFNDTLCRPWNSE